MTFIREREDTTGVAGGRNHATPLLTEIPRYPTARDSNSISRGVRVVDKNPALPPLRHLPSGDRRGSDPYRSLGPCQCNETGFKVSRRRHLTK